MSNGDETREYPPDLQWQTNIPQTLTFPYGDFKEVPARVLEDGRKIPERFRYTVKADDGVTHWWKATALAHRTLQAAGVRRGSIFEVGQFQNPEDKRKVFWAVTEHVQGNGAKVTDSRYLGEVEAETGPGAIAEQVASAPTPEPPPPESDDPFTRHSQTSGSKVPADTPARIGALYVLAGRVVEECFKMLRWDVSPDQKASTATGVCIGLEKRGWAARPEAVQAFIEAMRAEKAGTPSPIPKYKDQELAPEGQPAPKAPPPIKEKASDSLAGSGGIGSDEVFVLMQAAKESGVSEADLWKGMAKIWRAGLKLTGSSPLPEAPGSHWVDFTKFPSHLLERVDTWLTKERNKQYNQEPEEGLPF